MQRWLISITLISLFLLAALKSAEVRSLHVFWRSEAFIKLKHFQKAKAELSKTDQDYLELWESMLTGRSAPLSQWIKNQYRSLGLNHLFTPSGFHLTAVLTPFTRIFKSKNIFILFLIGILISLLPGQAALKRMILIKGHQHFLGIKFGFIVALLLDVFFGNFDNSTLSFSYSFFFLGIIYSGLKGFHLIFWFFFAQLILAYFQGNQASLLILIFSPLLNLGFGLAMPLLFLLSFPLWGWQLQIGIFVLKTLQQMVNLSAKLVSHFPLLEVNVLTIIIALLIIFKKRRWLIASVFIFHSSLNLDLQKMPSPSRYQFVPQGEVVKSYNKEDYDLIYFKDGKCKRKLIRGFWWENCSPKRGSKKIMKLSSL
ncbi:MAG: hypothetical protein AB7I27_05250 [Bacteriovoracaceae bacterium]